MLSYEANDVGSLSIICTYVPMKEMNVIDVVYLLRKALLDHWESALYKYCILNNVYYVKLRK